MFGIFQFLIVAIFASVTKECAGELTWSVTTAPTVVQHWTTVNSDSSGQNLVASQATYVFVSNDFGSTWINYDQYSATFVAFASDVTGKHVTGVTTSQGIFLSNNFGKSFNFVSDTYKYKNQPFSSVAASDDGSIQFAVVKGTALLMSTNYGLNWTSLATPDQLGNNEISWNSITTNFDGSCVYSGSNGAGSLYYSHNYGYNWTMSANLPDNSPWVGIVTSSDGSHVAAVMSSGNVYLSYDYGVNYVWTLQGVGNMTGITMSDSGQYLAVALSPGVIYTSNAYGQTGSWIASNTSGNYSFYCITGNSAGDYLVAGTSDSVPNNVATCHIYSTYPFDVPPSTDDDTHTNSQDDDKDTSNFFTNTAGGVVLIVVFVLIGLSVLVAIGYYFVTGKNIWRLCCKNDSNQHDDLKMGLV